MRRRIGRLYLRRILGTLLVSDEEESRGRKGQDKD